MAGMDEVLINTRERPVSSDINDIESMIHRNMLDVFRHGLGSQSLTTVGMPIGTPRNCILGGLEITPSGNDVSVSPGALFQDSAVLAPVPGALDSNYRVGVNRVATLIDMPDPGGIVFYLIEAQMVRTTTVTSSRDILDAGTGIFAPTSVTKQRERRIQFQIVTGSSAAAPAPSGGDWIPLAIVRRPGGGGPAVASDIQDVRPMWADRMASAQLPFSASVDTIARRDGTRSGGLLTTSIPDVPSELGQLRFSAIIPGTRGLGVIDLNAVNLTTLYEPGTISLANTWYYVYLCPWRNGLAPWRGDLSPQTYRGVLVVSTGVPALTLSNSVNITLQSPFLNSVAAGDAVYVGAIRRNAANDGWITMTSRDMKLFEHGAVGTVATVAASAVVQAYTPSPPSGARTARISVRAQNATANAWMSLLVRRTGGTSGYRLFHFGEQAGSAIFDWPLSFGAAIEYLPTGSAAGNITLTSDTIGYEIF